MSNPFSFEKFLWILENDAIFGIDETSFYFKDDPYNNDCMLGCIREYDKPYWVGIGYCANSKGCIFNTASELLQAKIFNGCSIKDKWENIVIVSIGGIRLDEWMEIYQDKL